MLRIQRHFSTFLRCSVLCSELDVQLVDVFGLKLGGFHPLAHERMFEHGRAVPGDIGIELDVVGKKARHDRGVHCIGHDRRLAEQPWATIALQAFAPDGGDTIDIGLGCRPDLEARITRLQIHRQGGAQIHKARMHFTRHRPAMGAGDPIGGIHACIGI